MPHLHQHVTTRQSGDKCCAEIAAKDCCPDYTPQRIIDPICYSEWLPNVRILAPHLPDNILLDYIRRAVIEFAKQSHILQRSIILELQSCVADYYPCLGEEERIATVHLFCIDGDCYKAQGNACEIGGHRYWFMPPQSLLINPAPTKTGKQLALVVDAVPSENSQQCDRIIYDRHFQAIEAYAAAQAALVPPDMDTPKSYMPRPELYPLRMEIFRQAISRAKIDIVRHYSTEGQTWTEGKCYGRQR